MAAEWREERHPRHMLRKSFTLGPVLVPEKNGPLLSLKRSSNVYQNCGLRLIPALNNSLKGEVGGGYWVRGWKLARGRRFLSPWKNPGPQEDLAFRRMTGSRLALQESPGTVVHLCKL